MANQNPQSFKPLTISAEQLPASMAQNEELTSYAASRAKLLLGCYRTGDANDPATYVAAITAILARFPEGVITAVTHPVTGLPSKKGWLPTVKEVNDACTEAVEPIIQHEARLKRVAEQFEMREREARGEKPTIDQMKAKYGPNWGIEASDPIKTADKLVKENREARERAEARMRAEYAEMGIEPPSKLALSQAALRIMREQDENRAALSQAAE